MQGGWRQDAWLPSEVSGPRRSCARGGLGVVTPSTHGRTILLFAGPRKAGRPETWPSGTKEICSSNLGRCHPEYMRSFVNSAVITKDVITHHPLLMCNEGGSAADETGDWASAEELSGLPNRWSKTGQSCQLSLLKN